MIAGAPTSTDRRDRQRRGFYLSRRLRSSPILLSPGLDAVACPCMKPAASIGQAANRLGRTGRRCSRPRGGDVSPTTSPHLLRLSGDSTICFMQAPVSRTRLRPGRRCVGAPAPSTRVGGRERRERALRCGPFDARCSPMRFASRSSRATLRTGCLPRSGRTRRVFARRRAPSTEPWTAADVGTVIARGPSAFMSLEPVFFPSRNLLEGNAARDGVLIHSPHDSRVSSSSAPHLEQELVVHCRSSCRDLSTSEPLSEPIIAFLITSAAYP